MFKHMKVAIFGAIVLAASVALAAVVQPGDIIFPGNITFSGTVTNTGSETLTGLTVGSGTGAPNININGGSSGTNAGPALYLQGNSATTAGLGYYSSIIGGSFDSRTLLYSSTNLVARVQGKNQLVMDGGLATFGDATTAKSVAIDAGTSGSNNGPSYYLKNGGTTTAGFGYYSAIIGGAYDTTTTLYSTVAMKMYVNGSTRQTLDTSGNNTFSGSDTAAAFIPSGATIPANGLYLPSANVVGIASNSLLAASFTGGTNAFTFIAGTNPAISTVAGNISLGSVGGATTLGDATLTITAAAPVVTNLATDATHTTRTVCQDTTSKALFFGSGAAGICLGTSSMRFKHDIAKLRPGLEVVRDLQPVSFVYNKGYGDDGARKQYGLIAEQVAKVAPEMVGLDKDGKPQSVDYGALFPILINAVQELSASNDNLRREVSELKRQAR